MIPVIASKRAKSRRDLDWIKKRLDVVALRIDEKQLNRYILKDLAAPQLHLQQYNTHNQENECHYHQANLVNISWEPEEASHNEEPWESFDDTNYWNVCTTTTDFLDSDWEPAHDISFENDEMERSHEFITFPSRDYTHVRYTRHAAGNAPDAIAEAVYHPQCAKQEVDYESDSDEVDSWAQESVVTYTPLQQQQQSPPRTDRHVLADIRNERASSLHTTNDRSNLVQKTSAVCQYHGATTTLGLSFDTPELSMSRTVPEKENQQLQYIDKKVGKINRHRRVRFDDGQNQLQLYAPNEDCQGTTTKQTSCDVPYYKVMSMKETG